MSFPFLALKPSFLVSPSLTIYSQIARVIIGINVVLFVAFTVVVHASVCVFTLSKKKVDYRAENTAAEERKKGIKFSN